MATDLSKEETESLLSSSKGKKRKEKKAPIENVEFLNQASDKEGWGKHPNGHGNVNSKVLSNRSLNESTVGTGNAVDHTSAKPGSIRSNNSNWSYSSNSHSHSMSQHGMSNAAAASANAAMGLEQHQQQQAYYAQQFYMQQQQQRFPGGPGAGVAGGGYVPWPAPQFQNLMPGVPGYPMHAPVPQGSGGGHTGQRRTIKATSSNGSEDDEHAALLHQKFTSNNNASLTGGGYGATSGGGYGSMMMGNSSSHSNNNNGRISPVSNASSQNNKHNSNQPTASSKIPPPPKPKHRRAQSDGVSFQLGPGASGHGNNNSKSQHPLHRTTSKEKPPMSNSSPRIPNQNRKTAGASGGHSRHGRSRSLSAGGIIGGLPSDLGGKGGGGRRTHRRVASNASSVGAGSVASEASFMSITSDIRKSAFYGGVDEPTGKTQLHYPNEHIYVVAVDDNDPTVSLQVGKVYKVAVDQEAFEEYHRQAEDRMWEDELGDLECQQHRCTCKCNVCVGCNGHAGNSRKVRDPFGALPSNQFALAVDPSVYKRVLDEISQAQLMPCGLFFCGHHEDVAHPSIYIALVMVIALFLTMGYAAWILRV